MHDLGPLALTLGLTRTAAHLGAEQPKLIDPPVQLDSLSLEQPDGHNALWELLRLHPHDPAIIERLAQSGQFEAMPASAALLAATLVDGAVWPSRWGTLRRTLQTLAGYANRAMGQPRTRARLEAAQQLMRQVLVGEAVDSVEQPATLSERTVRAKMALLGDGAGVSTLGLAQARRTLHELALAGDWEAIALLLSDDPTAISPSADAVVALLQQAWRTRAAGFPALTLFSLSALNAALPQAELWWLLADTMLDAGLIPDAGFIEAFPDADPYDESSVDAAMAARARIASQRGASDELDEILGDLIGEVRVHPNQAIDRMPRTALLAVERAGQSGWDEALMQALLRGLATYSLLPSAHRLAASISAAVNLGRGEVDAAFAMLDGSAQIIPADPSLWRAVAQVVAEHPQAKSAFLVRLAEHIANRAPFVRSFWILLQTQTDDPALATALAADLADAAAEPQPVTRPLACDALSRAASAAALEQVVAVLGECGPETALDPRLPVEISNWLAGSDPRTAPGNQIFLALQGAPLHSQLLTRLEQSGFFLGAPCVGSLAAAEIGRRRLWVGPPSPALVAPWMQPPTIAATPVDAVRESLGAAPERIGSSTWQMVADAKRALLERPSDAELSKAQAVFKQTGDVELAILLADRDGLSGPFQPLIQQLFSWRLAGLVDTVAWAARVLFEQTMGNNVFFLAVDALLACGDTAKASELAAAHHRAHDAESVDWNDLQRCAHLRVMLADRGADVLLAAATEQLAASESTLIERFPYSLFPVVDALLLAGDAVPDGLGQAMSQSLQRFQPLPYAYGVYAAWLYQLGDAIGDEEQTLVGLTHALRRVPGELAIVSRVAAQGARVRSPFQNRLLRHVCQQAQLRVSWATLAELSDQPELVAAVQADLSRR